MSTISYAQNHEDVVLDRAFPRGKRGFYIDVGANGPVSDSVTKHFYDLGWHGINVEPVPGPFQELAAARTRDVNLNVGLSDEAGESIFYEFAESTLSTFSSDAAARHRDAGIPFTERSVPTMTLAQVCSDHAVGAVDFLSIDVEGHELQVLSGADWTRWRPRIVLVEATEPTTSIPTHEQWEHVLEEAGYLFAAFDGLNRFYVRSEDADLIDVLSVPANPSDDYVPYRYHKIMEDLRWANDQASRSAAAARAVNQTLLWEVWGSAYQISLLRSQYERLDRALTGARASAESIRTLTQEAKAAGERLPAELASLASAAQSVEGAGPAAIGIARKLTALSSRHPKAATSAKRALRLGLRAKRAISGQVRQGRG